MTEVQMTAEELKEKIGKMSEEEIKEYFKNQPMKKYERLNIIFVKVQQLKDIMQLVDNNSQQLKSPYSQAIVQLGKSGLQPSKFLYEYVMLEINSFYDLVYKYKKEGVNLSEIPTDWKEIKKFRNSIPGHMDKDEKLKTSDDWFKLYESIDKLNTNKIIADFEKYYLECRKVLGNDI